MQLFNYMSEYGYEQLVMCSDPASGLKAIIAIHDTTLGPACGGDRFIGRAEETRPRSARLRGSRPCPGADDLLHHLLDDAADAVFAHRGHGGPVRCPRRS